MKMKSAAVGVLAALIVAGCASDDSATESKRRTNSEYEGFTIRRALREIFSRDTVRNAANTFFAEDIRRSNRARADLRSAHMEEELTSEFGQVNGRAVRALVLKDYVGARRDAAAGLNDADPNVRRVAAWVLALAARETVSPDRMEPYYLQLAKMDPRISDAAQAKSAVADGEEKLRVFRTKIGLDY